MDLDLYAILRKNEGKLHTLTDGTYDLRLQLNWISKSDLHPSANLHEVILLDVEVTNRTKDPIQLSQIFLKIGDVSLRQCSFEIAQRISTSGNNPFVRLWLRDPGQYANFVVPTTEFERFSGNYLRQNESTTGAILVDIARLPEQGVVCVAIQLAGIATVLEAELLP